VGEYNNRQKSLEPFVKRKEVEEGKDSMLLVN